jgi:hypothetical protein
MVDRQVLEAFTSEIEKRRRIRREKLVKEEKEREIEERNRRFGGRRAMGSFASYSDEEQLVESKFHDLEDVKWVIANALASVPPGTSPDLAPMTLGLPQIGTSTDTSTVARTVWGTPRVASSTATPVSASTTINSTPTEVAGDDSDEPGESGGMWRQNWEDILKADSIGASRTPNLRRKKGKKLVLMSNSVQRGI